MFRPMSTVSPGFLANVGLTLAAATSATSVPSVIFAGQAFAAVLGAPWSAVTVPLIAGNELTVTSEPDTSTVSVANAKSRISRFIALTGTGVALNSVSVNGPETGRGLVSLPSIEANNVLPVSCLASVANPVVSIGRSVWSEAIVTLTELAIVSWPIGSIIVTSPSPLPLLPP